MRAIANIFINLLPVFWLLILAGLIFRKKKPRLSFILFIAGFLLLAVCTTPPFPRWLVSTLENRYPPLTDPAFLAEDTTVHLLILGGGHTADPRLPENDQLSDGALARLVEGVRLHRLLPHSTLVLSGYSREGIDQSHAEVLAKTAALLGVDPEVLLTVTTPGNTEEEARDYFAKFGDRHRLVLVTSAVHMPRAMFLFRAAGLDPIPAPTHHLVKTDRLYHPFSLYPSASNLNKVSAALHEYVGMLYARSR